MKKLVDHLHFIMMCTIQGWSDTFANQASYKEHFWELHQKEREEKYRSSDELKESRGKKKWFGDWMETEQYKSR